LSIISDDDAGKPAASTALAPRPPAAKGDAPNGQDQDDTMPGRFDTGRNKEPNVAAQAQVTAGVIELAEAMQAKAPAFNGIDGSVDSPFDEGPGSERACAPQEPRAVPMPDRPLLSPRATAVVDSAFNSLSHTMLMQNPRTLEDLVHDMLRPMLKAWLDENLPDMVERLVRAEIERVSRGRG